MTTAADRYKLLLRLNPSQALAVEVLDRGGTHAEAAEAAGVDRTTVARWARHHPAFIAEINRRRLDRARSNERALADIDSKALAVLAEALDSGDPDLAFRWFKLRGLGGLTNGPVGPLDPFQLIHGRMRELADGVLASFGDCMSWSTQDRAVKAIWEDVEGHREPLEAPEPFDGDPPTDWKRELLDLEEPDDLLLFTEQEIDLFLENVDHSDPEVAAHVRHLGLEDEVPRPEDGQSSPAEAAGSPRP
jgi:hypothetical protein